MKNILVTGGAGYKGALLVKALLKRGCRVTVFDNCLYGAEALLGFASQQNFSAIKADIRNIEKSDVASFDVVYHLAGVSGFPACQANPHSARAVNVEATDKLVNLLSQDQMIVYASTTSLYGTGGDNQDESVVPEPGSLYGKTKLDAERICRRHPNSVVFRFATLFGVSPRMRVELLVHDFVHKAVVERCLVLFDQHSIRTFLHVNDAIRAYLMVLDHPESTVGHIFNVGSNSMNYSKLEIAQHIREHVSFEIVESSLEDPDRRNFIVNFDKIVALGFQPTKSLSDGIQELVRLFSWYRPFTPYRVI